jgi:hypothetical protein
MPTLRITIKLDNAAFKDNPGEVSQILHEFSQLTEGHAMLRPGERMTLHDSNGNIVGEATVLR